MNEDGIMDILATRIFSTDIHYRTTEVVLIYLKSGTIPQVETFTAESLGMSDKYLAGPLGVGDFDGDGGFDIVVGFAAKNVEPGTYTPNALIRRDKSGKLLELTKPWGPSDTFGPEYYGSTVQDINDDNRADLLVDGKKNSFFSWDNSSWKSIETNFKPSTMMFNGAWQDIDFDGKFDFLGYDEVWRNKGGGNFEKSSLGPWSPSQGDMIDIDLDGNLDLLGCDGWHRGDGFGNYDAKKGKVSVQTNYPSFCFGTWADVTGDGLPDAIGIGGTTIGCNKNIGKPILK
jgi:hypothetical protein